jgi:hypothetical protein
MTKSTFSRHIILALTLVLATLTVDCAYAGIPMPYTDEAVTRLSNILEKTTSPPLVDDPGENDRNVRSYIAAYREIFSLAGYDYERSVMKIINDIQFDRYRLNKATIKLNGLARELLRLHLNTGVDPKKYLGKDCANLLIEFRDLIRSNTKKYGGC